MSESEAQNVLLVAACALVDPDGRVLLAQRPQGKAMAGLWEFPGGKVEPQERPEQTVIRELREELAIDVTEACLAPLDHQVAARSRAVPRASTVGKPSVPPPGGPGASLGQWGYED